MLAAVLEAALAALYLEHGFEPIESAIVDAFESRIEFARIDQVDYKTELQEALAQVGRSVTYARARRGRPGARAPLLRAPLIDGEELGIGNGRTKKAAEQDAAKEALAAISTP